MMVNSSKKPVTMTVTVSQSQFNKEKPRENRMSQVQILSARPAALLPLGEWGFWVK